MHNEQPARIYSLDVLRGVAALSVVFWHWQHFFYDGTALTSAFSFASQPLVGTFKIFYVYGWLAVDLFFCLSGFIFYWLYAHRVASRAVSSREFFILRFSRLYPLQLLTLLLVLLGQSAYTRVAGSPFVFPNNDAFHFLLNVFFVSGWSVDFGPSFNTPSWSVSVEVALYGLFFILSRLLPIRAVVLFVLVALGEVVDRKIDGNIGRGMTAFFLGGGAFLLSQSIVRSRSVHLVQTVLLLVTVSLWALAVYCVQIGWTMSSVSALRRLAPDYPILVLFPLTVVTLYLHEARTRALAKRFVVLGDLSYSIYMLHFPIQLLMATIAVYLGVGRSVFYSPVMFAAFFMLVLVVSYVSHFRFERPAQRFIRRRFLAYT